MCPFHSLVKIFQSHISSHVFHSPDLSAPLTPPGGGGGGGVGYLTQNVVGMCHRRDKNRGPRIGSKDKKGVLGTIKVTPGSAFFKKWE